MEKETLKEIANMLSKLNYLEWIKVKNAIDKKYSFELTRKNNQEKLDAETILKAIEFEITQ